MYRAGFGFRSRLQTAQELRELLFLGRRQHLEQFRRGQVPPRS